MTRIRTISRPADHAPPRLTYPMWWRVWVHRSRWHGRVVGWDPLFTFESLHALRANRRIVSNKAARELG